MTVNLYPKSKYTIKQAREAVESFGKNFRASHITPEEVQSFTAMALVALDYSGGLFDIAHSGKYNFRDYLEAAVNHYHMNGGKIDFAEHTYFYRTH